MFLSSVVTFWSKWEIHFMISISMFLQSILIFTGNWRKYSADGKLQSLVWLAYSLADWWATLSLGILSSRAGCLKDNSIDPRFAISAFYAPFFLLHLGGPDTITAFSLEDNELWKRHSLTLFGQVGVAVYVTYRGWTKTALNKLAIPMFLPGIIQICERLWALRSASSENFKASMLRQLRPPDRGPNYARYMEEFDSKKEEGFDVTSRVISGAPIVGDLSFIAPENVLIADAATLKYAYIFFDTFKQLFANLILSFQDIANSKSFFLDGSYVEAFKVIEVELGFMYDVFYTKAFEFYSLKVGILRFMISFSFPLVALLVFVFQINKEAYSGGDKAVTYAVLGGAFGLELYALLIQLNSDWAMLRLSEHRNAAVDLLYKAISRIPLVRGKRWSNTMAQYKLIEFCLKDKHRYRDSVEVSVRLKELIFEQLLEKSKSASDLKACKKLCAFRGDQVLRNAKCRDCISKEERRTQEGNADIEFDPILINAKCIYEISKENQSILEESVEVEFDQSVLLWHIATNLCFNFVRNTTQDTTQDTAQTTAQNTTPNSAQTWAQHMTQITTLNMAQSTTQDTNQTMVQILAQIINKITTQTTAQTPAQTMAETTVQTPAQTTALTIDPNATQNTAQNMNQNSIEDQNCEASKLLSNYMLYLLVKRPAMLPNGIEQIRFQDTCAETTEFLEERKIFDEIQACTKLLEVCTNIPPSEAKGDRSKSVLFEGCRLAKSLQCLETKTMWELISHVWVEMLCYAASQCRSNHHAQQLTQGGELLTHVWLLMAHLGITEQFQISKGHARAMLVVN